MKSIDIYGTLGPSCCEVETLYDMFQMGMTGVRFNLSHVNLCDCTEWINNLNAAAKMANVTHKLLVDLKGPELRIGALSENLSLEEGKTVHVGKEITVPEIILPVLKEGQQVLLDDGAILLEVINSDEVGAECRILHGGVLRSRKSIALPNTDIYPPTLAESDLKNIAEAKKYGVTGVMLPFVRGRKDVLNLRRALNDVGASDIEIFAKLENMEGVEKLNEFIDIAQQIVIARGDLGNAIPLWELPCVQKKISEQCKKRGKAFMVVTQMLHSMHDSAVPTRAEVSDIFNAVLDGADSVMLTGETAAGKYPVEAMKYMCNTVYSAVNYMNLEKLKTCTLCPRNCKVDRLSGKTGFCGANDKLYLARAALHFWEEPCISGERGSGTVFFSGCNLRCVYCQNAEISCMNAKKEVTIERLAEIFLELQEKGALNINLVTPTHYIPQILMALDQAKEKGLVLPVVYNTSGYESVEVLKSLEGYVQVYLPDFKYMSHELAQKYSRAYDYPDKVKMALDEMVRQVGTPEFSEDGIIQRGVIVRHLVLPNHTDDSKDVIKYLYERYGDDIFISIMNQYTPLEQVKMIPDLNRKITEEEYDEVVDFAISLNVENGFIQEGETQSDSFIPSFDFEGV